MDGKYVIILFLVLMITAVGVFSFAAGFPDEVNLVFFEESISSGDAEIVTGQAVEGATEDPIIDTKIIKRAKQCRKVCRKKILGKCIAFHYKCQ